MELPEYSEALEVFVTSGLVHTPAEAHGILCGLLIKETSTPLEHYLRLISGASSDSQLQGPDTEALLSALYEITRHQLQDPNLGLELLLPEDDEPLDSRFDAAFEWARGLIYGFAELGISAPDSLPADSADFYRDCSQLARQDYEIEDDSVENEELYMELQEFLRMGTLLTQEELQPIKAPPQIH